MGKAYSSSPPSFRIKAATKAPYLPPELLAHIISFLPLPSLALASRTSSTFCALCRPLLYRTPIIRLNTSYPRYSWIQEFRFTQPSLNLLHAYRENPSLVRFARRLVLGVVTENGNASDLGWSEKIGPVLRKFKRVERLSVGGITQEQLIGLREVVEEHGPQVRELDLRMVWDMEPLPSATAQLLAALPTLTTLSLRPFHTPPDWAAPPTFRLDSLKLRHDVSPTTFAFLTTSSRSTLTSLTIRQRKNLLPLDFAALDQLEHLELSFGRVDQWKILDNTAAELKTCPDLKKLSISVGLPFVLMGPAPLRRFFASFPSSLVEVELNIDGMGNALGVLVLQLEKEAWLKGLKRLQYRLQTKKSREIAKLKELCEEKGIVLDVKR